jgi:hypothetical protein
MSFLPVRGQLGLALVFVGLLLSVRVAQAEQPNLLPLPLGVTEAFTSESRSGVALDGFDPITYRLGGVPREGSRDFEYVWRGVVWRFVSAANRAAFVRDPDVYAPRIGGYDAERIASNVLVSADPEIFVLRADGLYLFRSNEHRRRFLADEALAHRAESAWARTRPGLVQG